MTRKRKAERTSQAPVPVLDHGVITVANRLDEASARYRRLGFQLSERSHPTPGSSHHLAIFAENYLALLGYAPGRGEQHKDLWQAPLGLSGLVWKTQDAESAFQHLQRQDLDGEAPATFYRPVTLPDGAASEAHFRTVRLRPALIPNGQSFSASTIRRRRCGRPPGSRIQTACILSASLSSWHRTRRSPLRSIATCLARIASLPVMTALLC